MLHARALPAAVLAVLLTACGGGAGGADACAAGADDGNPCTVDTCNPATGAVTHAPLDVDDGDACTVDSCDPSTGAARHVAVLVDDGDACTVDTCDPATGAARYVAVPVDDGVPCTVDACEPATGAVTHVPDAGRCPAGEACSPTQGCRAPVAVGWCNTQWPPFASASSGGVFQAIYGQVWVSGVTEAAGPQPDLVARLGIGPADSDPRSDAGWSWTDGAYNVQSGNNDEYVVAAPVAPAVGAQTVFHYAWAMSADAAATWTYCGLLGPWSTPASSGVLTVTP